MRFYLFDAITGFTPNETVSGIKNITSQEEFLVEHYDRFPVTPSTILIESLAQLGGWGVTVSTDYNFLAVMVMIRGVNACGDAVPGDQVVLEVKIEDINEYGARISGSAYIRGRQVLSIDSLTYVLYKVPEDEKELLRESYLKLMPKQS